jgi:hypothetical protein
MNRQKTIKSRSDGSPSRTGSRPTTIRPFQGTNQTSTLEQLAVMSMTAARHGLPGVVHLFEFTGSGFRCDVLFGDA